MARLYKSKGDVLPRLLGTILSQRTAHGMSTAASTPVRDKRQQKISDHGLLSRLQLRIAVNIIIVGCPDPPIHAA